MKYVKLKKYLKEICESEKMAHTRNQEYLKQYEYIQAHIGHFTTTSTEKLQELKVTSCFVLCFFLKSFFAKIRNNEHYVSDQWQSQCSVHLYSKRLSIFLMHCHVAKF